jgi:hypothetical protein
VTSLTAIISFNFTVQVRFDAKLRVNIGEKLAKQRCAKASDGPSPEI